MKNLFFQDFTPKSCEREYTISEVHSFLAKGRHYPILDVAISVVVILIETLTRHVNEGVGIVKLEFTNCDVGI